jgi:hypothetical protein
MAGHTLSAYTDEQTYRRVLELARLEDRPTAQIVAAALRLYVRLPRRAQDAFRQSEAAGPDAADAAAWAAGRALLHQRYEAIVAKGLQEGGSAPVADGDEEGVLDAAVKMARRTG